MVVMSNDGDDGDGNDDGDARVMITCNYYGGVENDDDDEWGDD